jgi:hypothetical protein
VNFWFRAYREVNDDFDYFSHPEIETEFWNFARIHEFPLSQFIGIKDLLGTPIFVGDIVLDIARNAALEIVLESEKCRFFIREIHPREPSYRYSEIPEPIKIVGNIYQDKDLIRNQKAFIDRRIAWKIVRGE